MIFLYNNLMDYLFSIVILDVLYFICIKWMEGMIGFVFKFLCNMFLVVEFWEMIIIVCFVNLL